MTTDNFTEAARAEAERRFDFLSDASCFEQGAEWARAHLAAQEPTDADRRFGPRATAVIREWTGAHPAEDREPSVAPAARRGEENR